jgi:Zn-dependent membrane protease YugP
MYFDPAYLIMVMLPALVLGGLATLLTRTTFNRYSRVRSVNGLTGAQAARRLLDSQGLHEVGIEQVQGFLSDHYDPRHNVLRLSPPVYQSNSLAAIGVACHEAGHALQKAHRYAPLALRSALVPATQFGSMGYMWIIILGLVLHAQPLVLLGCGLLAVVVVFSLVTLPVEWNASARAKELMVTSGIVRPQEQVHAAKVLNAAFLTYLASAVTAILTLLYWLLRAGLLGGRRN